MQNRRHTRSIVASLALLLTNAAFAATEIPAAFVIRAGQLLDVRSGTVMKDVLIQVDGERITAVSSSAGATNEISATATLIDLGDATVLPGLIDCHTHLLARIPETSDGYALNLLTKSEAYRALEGAANARATLDAGITTVRDVGNEGSGYADVALRDAIEAGLVPGPRMRVATRAIAAVGQYHPFGISTDLTDFPTGAQMVSGVEEARRAVREQIGHGADLIKVYADWDEPTLTVAELQVVVEEAHKLGRKVAAHATTQGGIHNAVLAGVDSIEHGNRADRETLKLMKAKGTYLVPTLAAMDAWAAESPENAALPQLQTFMAASRASVSAAKELGVRIANGSDPAAADEHGHNAEELVALTKRGLSALDAIRAATTVAADLIGWADTVGTVEVGKFADLIAVQGDPLADVAVLQHVRFVMKGGRVIRNEISKDQ